MAAEETKAEPAPGPAAAPGAEQEVVAFAGGLRGRRAAQLGCGAGVDCVCLAAAGCRLVVGVDADGRAGRGAAARRGPRSPTGASSSRPTRWPWPRTSSSSARRRSSARAAGRRRRVALRRGGRPAGPRAALGARRRRRRAPAGGPAPAGRRGLLAERQRERVPALRRRRGQPDVRGALLVPAAAVLRAAEPPRVPLRRAGGAGAAALAWRAVFRRTPAAWAAPDPGDGDDDGASGTPAAASARASASGGGSLRKLRRDEPPRLLQKRRERPVVARKVSRVPLPLDARRRLDSERSTGAVRRRVRRPEQCGSDATSSFAGADGFENIAASRRRPPSGRARAEGDVPGCAGGTGGPRPTTASSRAADLQELCDRVARAALRWAPAPANPRQPLVAVDLAAGAGPRLGARAALPAARARGLVEQPRHGGARARARRAAGPRRRDGVAVPVERCAERLPARCAARRTASRAAALSQINEHDVLEAAAALLKPGGCLVLDLEHGEPGRAWEDHVRDALARPASPRRPTSRACPRCRRRGPRLGVPARGGRRRRGPAARLVRRLRRRRGRRLLRGLAVGVVVVARGGGAGDGDRAAARVARRECVWTRRGARPRLRGLRTALVVVLKPDARGRRPPENGVVGAPRARPGDRRLADRDLRVIDDTVTGCHRAQIIYFFRM